MKDLDKDRTEIPSILIGFNIGAIICSVIFLMVGINLLMKVNYFERRYEEEYGNCRAELDKNSELLQGIREDIIILDKRSKHHKHNGIYGKVESFLND